jgi:O-antigen/teichoic acid export membrane protein
MLNAFVRSPLLRAAGTYGLANVLRQALPVLLAPVLTHFLSPSDYGLTALFGVVVAAVAPCIGLAAHGSIGRQYFELDRRALATYVWNGLLLVGASSSLVTLGLWVGSPALERFSGLPGNLSWAVLGVAIPQSVFLVELSLLQAAGRALTYAILQIGRSVLLVVACLLCVVWLGQGWHGVIQAQLVSTCSVTAVACLLMLRDGYVHPRWRPQDIAHCAAYGGPLVLHSLSGVAMQSVDRMFVARYQGLHETGIYTIGFQLGAGIGLLEDAFNRAWQPWLFSQLKTADLAGQQRIVRLTYAYFVIITLGAIALGALAPWVLSFLVAAPFQGAHVFVIWIALGYAFNGMYKMVVGYLLYTGRTGVLAMTTLGAAIMNVLLNCLLVPRYGALGSALSTTFAFLISFLATWLSAARAYPMPWLGTLQTDLKRAASLLKRDKQ